MGGSSAGSYLADPTSPIPSHCASIVVTSTLRVYCTLVCLQRFVCAVLFWPYYTENFKHYSYVLYTFWIEQHFIRSTNFNCYFLYPLLGNLSAFNHAWTLSVISNIHYLEIHPAVVLGFRKVSIIFNTFTGSVKINWTCYIINCDIFQTIHYISSDLSSIIYTQSIITLLTKYQSTILEK